MIKFSQAQSHAVESVRHSMRPVRNFWQLALRDSSEIQPNIRSIRARVAMFGDAANLPQYQWVQLSFPNSSQSIISESYIADFGHTRGEFDLVVVMGNDPRRLRQLMRLYRPLLSSRPKIAVMQSSNPRDRAMLLNCGFDDVFDTKMAIPVVSHMVV